MKRLYILGLGLATVAMLFGQMLGGAFPIGCVLIVAVLYFRWQETAFWILWLSLWYESAMPLPLGAIALVLLAGGLLLQLLARHQLRANAFSIALGGMLLQSIAQITQGLYWPSRHLSGLLTQMTESSLQLVLAGVLSPFIVGAMLKLGENKLNCDLERRLKDL